MPGKKANAEAFASRWANKGNENQDTQRFWIDFYQNVLGVEDAVSRLEFEKPVSTDASTHDGYIDVFIPSAKTLVEQKSLGIDLAKEETRQGCRVTPAKQGNAYARACRSRSNRAISSPATSRISGSSTVREIHSAGSLSSGCRLPNFRRTSPPSSSSRAGRRSRHDLPRRFRRGRQDHGETS